MFIRKFDSCHGSHICFRESINLHDLFTVKVSKSETIVGHLPRSISSICRLSLKE